MPDLNPVAIVWALVVLTMCGLVVAALWPVPPRRAALVVGLTLVGGALLSASPVLLCVTCLAVTFLLLLVPPILPWRKEWARFAVPSTVLVLLALLAVLITPFLLAWLVLPLIAGVVGLLAASVHRWETARDVERARLSREAPPSPGSETGARGTDDS